MSTDIERRAGFSAIAELLVLNNIVKVTRTGRVAVSGVNDYGQQRRSLWAKSAISHCFDASQYFKHDICCQLDDTLKEVRGSYNSNPLSNRDSVNTKT